MTLEGIDCSSFQGAIDWNAVAAAGVAFACTKVSEGNGFEDPTWLSNAGPLAAPGPITAGAYHFARPDLGNTPEAEADWFWSTLTKRVPDPTGWLLALDLEVGSGDLSGWRDRWCAQLQSHAGGYQPGWYSDWNFALAHGLNVSTTYWGWLAWPDANGALPPAAFSIAVQQYGTRSVAGITGQVDADRFFGDVSQLALLTVGGGHMPLDPNDPVIVDLRNRIGGLQYGLNPAEGYNSQGEVTELVRRVDQNVIALGSALTGAKAELDQIQTELKSLAGQGVPQTSLQPLQDAVNRLGSHLGLGTA